MFTTASYSLAGEVRAARGQVLGKEGLESFGRPRAQVCAVASRINANPSIEPLGKNHVQLRRHA